MCETEVRLGVERNSFVRQLVPTRRRRHAPVAPKTTTSYACESRCDMRFLGYSGRHVHVESGI